MVENEILNKGFEKIRVGVRNKNPTIAFSSGKNKYIRFTKVFIREYKLEGNNFVIPFIKTEGNKRLLAFRFLDERKEGDGTLKISFNEKTGTGYISGSNIYNELKIPESNKNKMVFTPRKEVIGNEEYYIIEIKV